MNEQLQTMHLFAGAGGGLLCDLILGHKPIVAVEWDGYACQVLRERAADGWFPDLYVWEGDVRLFDPSEYKGRVGILHAGFPCQDISAAGNQRGIGVDTRSGLYREVLRVASIVRPRYIFLENVAAIASKSKDYLEVISKDLFEIGYDARWLCLSAAAIGAPHKRDRWWLRAVRNADNDGQPSAEISRSIASGSDDYKTREKQASKLEGSGEQFPYVADTVRTRLQGHREITGGIEQEHHDTGHDRWWSVESVVCGMADELAAELHQIEPHSCEQDASARRPAHGSWWGKEPDVGRVTTDKLANRTHRIKALGNGQVPLQAAVAWRMLGGE
jgi:DNA (cytosine-5)-methyltransferase 1